ncbi:sigma-54-dependent Fis family transcriptional regulator [Collibacillus ludicampi]|uniref:Sigma-54-dependent Fis family transcriptional regulator n=1 Tax=Collibacillus ludicampi TaxID=2771369 RepID=A0AAV4LFX0_9BACL|nr:sigma-54-dependent Fis family transcriptional regulator [Collibacillus ludicampi]GIM46702.1 sigma-54-dependent Fis family transcriptional regulator [Collibacillus ludicampi]
MRGSTKDFLKKSWERSSMYGVDPQIAKDAILGADEFKKYREQKQSFLQEVKPTIERMFHGLKSSGSIALLADPQGYILESMGDPEFLHDVEKIHLHQGACWSEQARGTNAIGTVIAERHPLEVMGKEHYLEVNHILFCAASPIFNPLGDLVAVLDVSGYHEKHHPLLLGMVDVIARSIEDSLLIRNNEKRLILSLYAEEERAHRALIAVDEEGIITGVNREARSLLEWNPAEPIALTDLLSGVEPLIQRSHGKHRDYSVHKKKNGRGKLLASVWMDMRPPVFPVSPSETKSKQAKQIHSVRYTFSDIFGNDKYFLSVLEFAKRAAATDYAILVTGESGTGKEMVSQAIHHASKRADRPFIALNCGAITKTLLESELFGYEAGAFTGAKQSGHAGKIELAHGGTLFLDEIAEMPLDMQVALLRVLQEFTVTRISGSRPIPVDVRIIAATHKDLWQEVQEGRFRADLFFRLQGVQIKIPPLREREDRLNLAVHLLKKIRHELGKNAFTLSPNAQQLIETYSWPGNIRELNAALRHAAFVTTSETIDVHHFPSYILSNGKPQTPLTGDSLKQIEYQAILETLQRTEGNVAQAARILGIGRNTLYRKLKKLM